MIRPMNEYDVVRVVDIHMSAFPGFFLSYLGRQFLTTYYKSLLQYTNHIARVYDDHGHISGFIVGTTDPSTFYSHLIRKNLFQFFTASLWAAIKKPIIIIRLFRALFQPSKQPSGDHILGLYSLAVSPESQNKGIGRQLVMSFIGAASHLGCKQIVLTTDRDGNDAVNSFYASLDFIITSQYATPEGRRMNTYTKFV